MYVVMQLIYHEDREVRFITSDKELALEVAQSEREKRDWYVDEIQVLFAPTGELLEWGVNVEIVWSSRPHHAR